MAGARTAAHARLAGRGAGGRDATGARPPRLLQPGVADLPLRCRRRRAARRARRRLRARPRCGRRRRRWSSTSSRRWRRPGRLAPVCRWSSPVPMRCAPMPRPGWTQIVRSRGHGPGDAAGGLRRRGSRSSGWWPARRRPVRLAPDATPEHTTYRAAAARGGRRRGSRLARRRELRVRPRRRWSQRLPAGAARHRSRSVSPLRASSTGRGARLPQPPRAGTPTWRGSSRVRVRVELAVASALLRPPFGAADGLAGGPAPPRADARAQRHGRDRAGVGGAVSGASCRRSCGGAGVRADCRARLAGAARRTGARRGAGHDVRADQRRCRPRAHPAAPGRRVRRDPGAARPGGAPRLEPVAGRRAGVAVHRRRTRTARSVDGTAIDLVAETLTADLRARRRPATTPTTAAVTDGRPWGARNPRWRLFVQHPGVAARRPRRRSSAPATSRRGLPTTRPTTTATRPPTRPTAWTATASCWCAARPSPPAGRWRRWRRSWPSPAAVRGWFVRGFACSPGARWARAFLDPLSGGAVPSDKVK